MLERTSYGARTLRIARGLSPEPEGTKVGVCVLVWSVLILVGMFQDYSGNPNYV